MVPDDVIAFGRAVVTSLQQVLGDDGLVGACYVGSVALGGYVPSQSDLDVAVVSAGAIPVEQRVALAEAVLVTAATCPARGLELTVYRRDVAAAAPDAADFEVNVNGGPRMPRTVHLRASDEPGFWYVLDRAVAHRSGVAISGPPPAELFADVPRQVLLGAMAASMRWHREHERATLHSVLNAARAWRFAEEDVLGSKLEGAAWARERWSSPSTIDAAVELRHGGQATLRAAAVDALLGHVEAVLRRAG